MSLRFALIIQVIGYLVMSPKQLDYVDSKTHERIHTWFLSEDKTSLRTDTRTSPVASESPPG